MGKESKFVKRPEYAAQQAVTAGKRSKTISAFSLRLNWKTKFQIAKVNADSAIFLQE
jgi:hypothetical protein